MEWIRETVFEHEEGRDKATITAAELWSRLLLLKLKALYPDDVDIYENKDGSVFGHVPYEWMKLVPPRRISEEHREKLRENAKATNAKKKSGR